MENDIMTEFIQLHMLASYPPSNLNRDELGRPKTAVVGNIQRIRISSQSLKRAWRTSDVFREVLGDYHLGIRTREMGWNIYCALTTGRTLNDIVFTNDDTVVNQVIDEENAVVYARSIAEVFGKLKNAEKAKTDKKGKKNKKSQVAEEEDETTDLIEKNDQSEMGKKKRSLCVEQVVNYSPNEIAAIDALISRITRDNVAPIKDDLKLLRKQNSAVDIAMFGRMLASSPEFNQDAAVQVAHAFTVHAGVIEDDCFTAVDDLNPKNGAAHFGETEFASGLFYLYVCVNRDLLVENLDGDTALADNALRALVETAAKISPTGKQNSFASRAYASYLLVEKGHQQPRSLASAYLKPAHGADMIEAAITTLNEQRTKMDAVYGVCSDRSCEMNVHTGTGTLTDILNFVVE
jgi:CRISPR system Cascade subunit CasC